MGTLPPADLNIYDRMLLRKYSVSGNASMPSDCSSLASPPVESTRKRRRFFKKGKAQQRHEKRSWSGFRRALPADFCPRSQSHLFEPVRLFLILLRVLCHPTSRYCIIRWSEMELYHWVTCRNLLLWRHLHADQRTGCKLQRFAVTDSAASITLAALRRESEHRASVEKSILDQLVIAADMRPKRFRTKWQRIVFDGPTARKDAESAERDRWIQLLANLLRSTDTPMGKLIRENPSNVQLLGGGRRAGTLRSRVRSVQKFLGWLAASHGISFPVHWRQLDRIFTSSVF